MRTTLFFLAVVMAADVFGMTAEPTRLNVWRRGETIGGEEFVANNEAVGDYIATLPRPTELLKPKRFNCMAKMRDISPTARPTSGSGPSSSVVINTVYELRDCVEAH